MSSVTTMLNRLFVAIPDRHTVEGHVDFGMFEDGYRLGFVFSNNMRLSFRLAARRAFFSDEGAGSVVLTSAPPEVTAIVPCGSVLNGNQFVEMLLYTKFHLQREIDAARNPLTYQRLRKIQEQSEMKFRQAYRKAAMLPVEKASELYVWEDDTKHLVLNFRNKNAKAVQVTLIPYIPHLPWEHIGFIRKKAMGIGNSYVEGDLLEGTRWERLCGAVDQKEVFQPRDLRWMCECSGGSELGYINPDDFVHMLEFLTFAY